MVELVGQLLSLNRASLNRALEARVAELEGQHKPPTAAVKKSEPPSWVKANRPTRPGRERKRRAHGFARRREEPTHRAEHAIDSCPDCQIPLLGGRVRQRRQVISIPRLRARVTEHVVLERTWNAPGTHLPQVPEAVEAVDSPAGLELPERGAATDGHLGAKRSKRAEGGVPAAIRVNSAPSQVALWPAP